MTGIIVSIPPTVEVPPGNNANNPSSLPPVTYQYAVINAPQTWGAKQTFPLGNISVQWGDIQNVPVLSVPGGSTTQVQYNNAGTFGGDAGLTYAIGGPLTIAPTVNTTKQGLVINQTLPTNGTTASSYAGNLTTITNPNFTSTATGFDTTYGLYNGSVSGSRINYLSGGGGVGQLPIQIGAVISTAITSQGQQLVGLNASAASNVASAGNDRIWGLTGYAYLGPLANLNGSYAVDAQSAVSSGAVVVNRVGVSIESLGTGSGTTIDSAITIASLSSLIAITPTPFVNAITLWTISGTPPLASTGSVITSNAAFTAANFANLSNVTFTGKIFDFGSSVFQMDGLGNITSGATLISVLNNNNGSTSFRATNANTGINASAAYALSNSVGTGGMGLAGTGATFLPNAQNRVYIDATATLSGILINNEGANPTVFATSSSEVARVLTGLMVGTTTDPGAGKINVATGYRIANAAASGNVLRGNGTDFVSSQLLVSDLNDVAWTTYTPTITSGTGTITTASATGRYKKIGKKVDLQILATITTAGTGAGQLKATLPLNSAAFSYAGIAKESALTGKSGAAQILGATDATVVQGIDSAGTTFIASGGAVNFGITYEIP